MSNENYKNAIITVGYKALSINVPITNENYSLFQQSGD
jgi:hypothetical protein